MRKLLLSAVLLIGSTGVSAAADLPLQATPPVISRASPTFFVHLGPAGLVPDAGARIKLGGTRLQGASIDVPPTVTAAVELGYFVAPNWAISASAGFPPTSDVKARGSIAALGRLGTSVAGPVAVTAHYHVFQLGAFQPYVGGGVTYLTVFGSSDGALSRYRLEGAFGAVGQVGADLMLTDNVGVFADVKKAYLRTNARGSFAGLPVRSEVRLDPLAVTGGVTLRF